jgi:hypothetical protein
MDGQTATPEIKGLPPGAIVKPLANKPALDTSKIKGLPQGAVVKPITSQDDAMPPELAGPSVQELASSNPHNEGLYHMKDKDGHSYAVPFSKVEEAGDNWRNMFVDEKEAEQYEKDKRSEGNPLSVANMRKNISKEERDVKKTGHVANDYVLRPLVNTANAAARTVVEPVIDYIDNGTASREELEKRGQQEWENSAFGRAEADKRKNVPIGEVAKDVAQVAGDAVPIIPVGTQGRQIAHEVTHGHKMDAATDLAGMGLVAGLTHGIAKTVPTELPSPTETLRRAVGTDVRATEDLIRKTKTANEKAALAYKEASPEQKAAIDKVREENDAAKAEHDKKVEAIRKENEEKQDAHDVAIDQRNKAVAKKVDFSRKMGELKSRIFPKNSASRLKVIQDAAKQYFNRGYDTLGRLTSKQRGDLTTLSSLLDDAESKVQGSDTNVAIFNDIRKRINGEKSSQTPPPREEWEAMSPDEQAAWRKNKANSGISYEDLRGYFRELGKLIGSDSTPGDIKTAAGVMRDGLEKMQADLAEKSGLRAKNLHDKLSREYRDYAETMLDKGSPVTKMLNAKDADAALKVFEGMTPFQKSYALDLLKGTGEHSDWLRRTERVEGGVGEDGDGEEGVSKPHDGGKILTPVESRAKAAVEAAQEKLNKAKEYLKNPPEIDTLQPGWEEGQKKAVARAEEELGKAKADADAKAKKPPPDPKGKRRLRNMRNYRQETSGLVRNYLDAQQGHDSLTVSDKPPKPPKLTAISPERLRLEKQEAIDNFFEKLRKNRVRVGVAGVGTIGLAEFVSHAMGLGNAGVELAGGALMMASAFGPSLMMKLLKFPGVVESLKVITKADEKALAKLPANQRVVVEENIIGMTQHAKAEGIIKPSDPTPLMKFAKQDLPKAKEEAAKAKEEPKPEPPPEEPPPVPPKPGTPPDSPATQSAVAEPKPDAREALSDFMEQVGTRIARETHGQGILDDMDEAGESPADVAKKFWKETYFNMPAEAQQVMQKQVRALTGMKPGDVIGVKADGTHIIAKDWMDIANQALDLPDKVEHLEGPERGFVAMMKDAVDRFGKAPEPPPAPTPKTAAPKTLEGSTTPKPVSPQSAEVVTPPPAEPAPTGRQPEAVPSRRLEDLHLDPKRFQYKLGGNKAGVTDSLSDARWNQDLADPIHIWEDPADGKEYVVNGHHRYELARNAGAEHINVASIDNTQVKTAAEARHYGAMKNIADGNGTAVDAAKFFRDSGFGIEDLKKEGLSLKKSVANEGLALSRLSDELFDRVVDGDIDPKIGAAIGEATELASDQEAILKDIKRKEKSGTKVTPDQIRESARLVKAAPSFNQTTQDLFGEHNETRNLFVEMGEVSDYIQKQLASEKRVFGSVSDKARGEQLSKGGNVIKPEENAKIANSAAQQRELYSKRSLQAGPIHSALKEAAERLAEGDSPNEVKQSAYKEIREHLAEELGETE